VFFFFIIPATNTHLSLVSRKNGRTRRAGHPYENWKQSEDEEPKKYRHWSTTASLLAHYVPRNNPKNVITRLDWVIQVNK